MSDLNFDWGFNKQAIRHRATQKMVSITDLWKAQGKPSSMRPDKWFKSESIQTALEKLSVVLEEGVKKDGKEKIIGIPGVLEIVRGGRYGQGTFVSYDLGLEYAKFLGEEVYQWFISVLPNAKMNNKKANILSLDIDDKGFKDSVRTTPDGRISVYDGIQYVTGHKNPRQVWNDLIETYPVFVQKTDKYKFPGRGGKARPTPVATLQVFLEILTTLPGRIAATVREKAVSTLIRVLNGDPTLVEEIMDRMSDPEDIRSIEESAKARRKIAYGSDIPSGTLSNPLTEIAPEIKQGYGWANKTPEMVNLLVDLATHVGDVIIQRDSPHRPYSQNSKKGKSRIIPLTLKSVENLNVLHIYWFESTFIDDADVVEIFQKRAYPEIAYRDFRSKGIEIVVAYLVSPGGITEKGVERLYEIQELLDRKFDKKIQLNSMRLDEMVWGYMYPAIADRYQDSFGKFATHNLNMKVKSICEKLCSKKVYISPTEKNKNNSHFQLSLLELLKA